MYFTKVLVHQILFIIFCWWMYFYYLDSNIIITILASLQAYIASYFISCWIIQFIYKCFCAEVETENRCVLITGCDSGFGHQSALLLNKSGFKVFATCMEPSGPGAKSLIEKAEHPKKMIIIEMDVTKDKDIERAYETVQSSMSYSENLFGLVNNAGIAVACEFEFGPDLQDCKKIIDVNLMGMIKVTRKFLPLIRQAKGRIVNIESLAGIMPIPQAIFYGISKFGAAGFSDNLRTGMYRFGVSVISINPWLYKTPITNSKIMMRFYESSFKNSSEEVRKAYGKKFMEKGKIAVMSANLATKSSAVPDTIVSALTVYEPDPRYIVAPMIFKPLINAMLWMPRETLEVWFQLSSRFFGTHKVYPDN